MTTWTHRLSDAQSVYPADYKPPQRGGWLRLAADQANLGSAKTIVAERLGLDPFSHWAPNDIREWKHWDTFGRLEAIRDWIADEINEEMDRSLNEPEVPSWSL